MMTSSLIVIHLLSYNTGALSKSSSSLNLYADTELLPGCVDRPGQCEVVNVSPLPGGENHWLVEGVSLTRSLELVLLPSPGQECHHTGHLLDQPHLSALSLSLCDGLVSDGGRLVSGVITLQEGHIHTRDTTYFIAPLHQTTERCGDISCLEHRLVKISSRPAAGHHQHQAQRPRRAIGLGDVWPPRSVENWIEVLVVVDGPMVTYHGSKVRHYVLTLMRMVDMIYRDKSVGNLIRVSVVKLILLKNNESFASGSRTGENICRDPLLDQENCDTLGLAELATMCNDNSCAIVQDNGLSAAFTIAHELGHVMNMPHDDDEKCEGTEKHNQTTFVMSRTLDHNSNPWEWSSCSRDHVTHFIDNGFGHCLKNSPRNNQLELGSKSGKLAGEFYDSNAQCSLVFGEGSSTCSYMPSCSRLWCSTPGGEELGCKTQHMPWADGTPCGEDRWCLRSECVARHESPPRQDGSWGEWASWSSCSRTCGGGVRRAVRECSSPPPSEGGLYCTGDRLRYQSCATHSCPQGEDFRDQQCRAYNGLQHNITDLPATVKWTAKMVESDKCRLYCRAEHSSAYYLLSSRVVDGTPCSLETEDMCVGGHCVEAGCDRVLGSQARADQCSVCGGDGTTCHLTQGSTNSSRYGYNSVVRIPAGATNIRVTQTSWSGSARDDNYIAVRDSQTGEYLINGGFVLSMYSSQIQYGQVILQYTGSDVVTETLTCRKPLSKDLIVEVLTVGSLYPPQLNYSFMTSKEKLTEYRWELADRWEHCDKLCKGRKRSIPVCLAVVGGRENEADPSQCQYLARPETVRRRCNSHCRLEWREAGRGTCSADCGPGQRTVEHVCVRVTQDSKVVTVPDTYCRRELSSDPPSTVPCEGECEGLEWEYGAWSACSKTCGPGTQTRTVTCRHQLTGSRLQQEKCEGKAPAVRRRDCQLGDCPGWRVGEWSACSSSCGPGVEVREVWCEGREERLGGEECGEDRPGDRRECGTDSQCGQWRTGQWSECSSHCGPGTRDRDLLCLDPSGLPLQPHLCSGQTRPVTSSTCVVISCREEGDEQIETNEIGPVREREERGEAVERKGPSQRKKSRQYRQLPRFRWKIGRWSECSEACGGEKTRVVACYDRVRGRLEPDHGKCGAVRRRPRDSEECSVSCPAESGVWSLGHWSQCSSSCGPGVRWRGVKCLQPHHCHLQPEPVSEEACQVSVCQTPLLQVKAAVVESERKSSSWVTGEWSRCSSSCGGGVRTRLVQCYDSHQVETDPASCLQETSRPYSEDSCNPEPCPVWNYGQWSECEGPCGGGRSRRLVRCQDHLGQTLADNQCRSSARPPDWRQCGQGGCGEGRRRDHLWRVGQWGQCSKSCGKGEKFRLVQCVDVKSRSLVAVSDSLCTESSKPLANKFCNKQPCPFVWEAGDWSPCSHSCGHGLQTRTVSCHRVNTFSWVDPETTDVTRCSSSRQPAEVRRCKVASCEASVFWQPGSWTQCQWRQCGVRGRQRRPVLCVNKEGRRVSRRHCKREHGAKLRPQRKRKCEKKLCGHSSCLQVAKSLPSARDGEFTLLLGGRNVTVYCHNMNSSSPREFLTLPTGETDNYSEVFGLRLVNPDSCPNNGSRHSCQDCVKDDSPRVGRTVWTKISLNMTSLSINPYDFTFARLVSGTLVPYGEAGDCYSLANCPQGRFSINLSGTGLRVADHSSWIGVGNKPAVWLQRIQDNQIIHGKCGGYCGTCEPEHYKGLKLDVVPY